MRIYLPRRRHQQGAVLMITLVSLVMLLLAAVALFRSVDTGTLVSGNLALRQAAAIYGDKGVNDAVAFLIARQASNSSDPAVTPGHPLNATAANVGYYSFADPNLNLMAATTWVDGTSSNETSDAATQNSSRYIIQRMCRTSNGMPTVDDCLMNFVDKDNFSKQTGKPVPVIPQNMVLYRVTVRVTGPKNTVSYIQAFVN